MGKRNERPSWEESFMASAYLAAARSSCNHLHTGVAVVIDKRVIATGYNGAPPGIENCLDRGCRKDEKAVEFDVKGTGTCRGTHAEINAMSQIPRNQLIGTTIYTVYFPCSACAKAITGNGIGAVVYDKTYKGEEELAREIFAEAGIRLRRLELDVDRIALMIKRVKSQKG